MWKVLRKISDKPNPAILILSLTAGVGFILMALALAFGVIQGLAADSGAIGLTFAAGLALFILGFVGWLAVAQPHKHFDDINVPQYTGHHDGQGEGSHG